MFNVASRLEVLDAKEPSSAIKANALQSVNWTIILVVDGDWMLVLNPNGGKNTIKKTQDSNEDLQASHNSILSFAALR